MHYQRTPQTIARRYGFETWDAYFWSRVDNAAGPGACWPWTGAHNGDGYGICRLQRRLRFAHRTAWELTHGPIDAHLRCLHRCDNPGCCNPAHLFLGTQADNIADMMAKGRSRKVRGDEHWTRQRPAGLRRGTANPQAKLNEDDVRAIRQQYAAGGTSYPKLARQFGVAQSLIGLIVKRRAWAHVE